VSQLVAKDRSFELCKEHNKLNLSIIANTEVMKIEVDSTLHYDVQKGQLEDRKIHERKRNIKEEKSPSFSVDDQAVLWYKGRICVPNIEELKDKILQEVTSHLIPYIQEGIRCTTISRQPIGCTE
jgi:sortase (surface protein transpeptidase)